MTADWASASANGFSRCPASLPMPVAAACLWWRRWWAGKSMRHNKTILIVEDEADARNYFQMVVRWLGYPAEIAEDGEEALACLDANRAISLVLLDLRMPRRDGLETLREMRNAGRHQPVIMLSGAATTTNVVQAIKAGATDFLAKPISHEDLSMAIRSALNDEEGEPL